VLGARGKLLGALEDLLDGRSNLLREYVNFPCDPGKILGVSVSPARCTKNISGRARKLGGNLRKKALDDG
jgi:hypothetical protein